MKKLIHWPSLVIGLGIAAGLGVLLHFLSNLGWWPSFAIGLVALLVNGLVATIEDEMPGGFNNPKPVDERKSDKTGS